MILQLDKTPIGELLVTSRGQIFFRNKKVAHTDNFLVPPRDAGTTIWVTPKVPVSMTVHGKRIRVYIYTLLIHERRQKRGVPVSKLAVKGCIQTRDC